MNRVLIDTHVWAWSLQGEAKLTDAARRAIHDATEISVSPISFYEIAQKVRLGKWPEMAPYVDQLSRLAREQQVRVAALEPVIGVAAGLLDWWNRDPFDRIIISTALHYGSSLISADRKFDGVIVRIW